MKKSFAMLFAIGLAGATLGAQEPERFFQTFVAGGDGQIDFMRTPLQRLLDDVAAGRLPIQVGRVFRLDEIVEAHRCMEENQAAGKIVVLT